ncbi:hypothetical protein F4604DRAFT_1600049 [Suillus subluteus]|nr:hypothetical protein F4604DRAFT_1600049 [Suillus subluteus]
MLLAPSIGHDVNFTLGVRLFGSSQRPNAWNAFVRQRLDDINEGLSKGNRWKLTEFIESHKETLRNNYARLSCAQKNNYEVEIMKIRADKQRMVHDNPRAVQHDMQATFAAMDQEVLSYFLRRSFSDRHIIQWTAICSRLGVEGFYVAVRGGIEDLSGPKLFFSEKAEKFVRAVLDLEPQRLALKLEAFAVSGLSKEKKSLNQLVSECWMLIQDELDFILRKNKLANHAKMNYTNYEHAIVEHYGVELKGWPFELLPVRNPSRIGGRKSVQLLINTLIEETCKWTKLTEEELADRITSNHARQAAGETVYKPWKARAKKTVEKSAAIVESSSESDENEGDDGGNE